MPKGKEEKVEGMGKDHKAGIFGEGSWEIFMIELYHMLSELLLEQLHKKLLPPKSADIEEEGEQLSLVSYSTNGQSYDGRNILKYSAFVSSAV